MVDGTTDDLILVAIGGNDMCYFETPEIGLVGAMNGTDTTVTIPAGTLPPGRPLELELVFVKVVDQDMNVSFNNFAAFASVTITQMGTSGDPNVPLQLTVERTAGEIVLTTKGEVGYGYEIQASEDAGSDPSSWMTLDYDYISDDWVGFLGAFQFTDFEYDNFATRFYRVIQMSNEEGRQ